MNSIAARLTVAAGIVLTAFVLFTAIALQQSVEKRARSAQFDRLQGLIYGLLGATDISSSGTLQVSEFELPDRRLNQPGSPIVAQITSDDNRTIWQSGSLIFDLPESDETRVGEWHFDRIVHASGDNYFVLRFTVEWEADTPPNPQYTFTVAQNTASFDRLISKFDTNLWTLLSISSVLLLAILYASLYWGLAPLKRVTRAIAEVESGKRNELPQDVPRELAPLTSGLNDMLRSEHQRQERYKNALDDLAHSLKTPLSVVRNMSGDININEQQRAELNEQVQHMDQIIARQLHATATGARSPLSRQINLHTLATRLGKSLGKVYSEKMIRFDYAIDKSLSARVNEGDMLEIVGNLMENACKYARSAIRIAIQADDERLSLQVEDDGPGFPADFTPLTQRGLRADTQHDGQGIGLAIVADLVAVYQGHLSLEQSKLGGACVDIILILKSTDN